MSAGLLDWLKRGAATFTMDQRRARVDAQAVRTHEEVVERYEHRGEIARGGMGTIRRATDRELLRTCAMKVLQIDGAPDAVSYAQRVFVEEAQITAQLDHPNIVPIYELGRDANGTPFFTMKLV